MSKLLTFAFLTTLIVILEAKEKIDYVCPRKSGLFPHPEQCDRYFECKNYQPRRKLCADGLVYDPDKIDFEDPCDHIQNTKHKCK